MMTLTNIDFEQLLSDRRFRIGAGVTWVVLALVAVGFLVAAKAPMRPLTASSLPSQPLSIPMMRGLPQPEPMKLGSKRVVLDSGALARRR